MTSSFHGRTIGALSVGSNKAYKSNIGPVPGKVRFCNFNDSKNLKKLTNKKTSSNYFRIHSRGWRNKHM